MPFLGLFIPSSSSNLRCDCVKHRCWPWAKSLNCVRLAGKVSGVARYRGKILDEAPLLRAIAARGNLGKDITTVIKERMA